MERPGFTAAFREDYVRVVPVSRNRPGWKRLPASGAENFTIQQDAGELRAWCAAILRDGHADARERYSARGEVQRWATH